MECSTGFAPRELTMRQIAGPPRSVRRSLPRLALFVSALTCVAPRGGVAAPAPESVVPDAARLENLATDPPDVSAYLAYWQARAYARALAAARPAMLNQLAYDVRH